MINFVNFLKRLPIISNIIQRYKLRNVVNCSGNETYCYRCNQKIDYDKAFNCSCEQCPCEAIPF